MVSFVQIFEFPDPNEKVYDEIGDETDEIEGFPDLRAMAACRAHSVEQALSMALEMLGEPIPPYNLQETVERNYRLRIDQRGLPFIFPAPEPRKNGEIITIETLDGTPKARFELWTQINDSRRIAFYITAPELLTDTGSAPQSAPPLPSS